MSEGFAIQRYPVSEAAYDVLAQDCGFDNAQAAREAIAAERARMTPEMREMLDETNRRIQRTMLFGE